MDDRGLLDLIISRLPGLNSRDRICLCEKLDREGDLIKFSKEAIEGILGHSLKNFWDIDEICAMAQRDAAACRMRSIHWVNWKDPDYPPALREIYDPPAILFFRGCLPNPQKPLLGMVGTRKPSPEAAAQAFTLARDLGRMGISVVSGLAIGIDAMSHKGNLEGGAPTFSVLGSGVDEVYPLVNRTLAMRILDNGGAILSEYPPGTAPLKWNFPARNRIISGLSRSVLIVEAPQRSGALITADMALDQGRELWVASSGIGSGETGLYDKRGTAKLAGDGAEIIHQANDVLEKWEITAGEQGTQEYVPVENSCVNTGRALAASMAKSLDIDL
jgi:DNA processing protein